MSVAEMKRLKKEYAAIPNYFFDVTEEDDRANLIEPTVVQLAVKDQISPPSVSSATAETFDDYSKYKKWECNLPEFNQYLKRLSEISDDDRRLGRRLCREYEKQRGIARFNCFMCAERDGKVHTLTSKHCQRHYCTCMSDAMHWFFAIHPKFTGKHVKEFAERLNKWSRFPGCHSGNLLSISNKYY